MPEIPQESLEILIKKKEYLKIETQAVEKKILLAIYFI